MINTEDIAAAGTHFSMALDVINNLQPEEIPAIINSQYHEIEIIDTQIKKIQSRTKEAEKDVKKAKESADSAKEKSAGFGQKKVAIESLQDATADIAEAQSGLAEVQIDTLDAVQILFEHEKKLGQSIKFLFALGVSNITANRAVVRELQYRLQGASEDELSDFARQELESVVRQLKAQADMMIKQESLSSKVKQHSKEIEDNTAQISAIEKMAIAQAKQMSSVVEKNLAQDQELLRQEKQNKEYSRRLDSIDRKAKEQDHCLDEMGHKDEEQDRRLDEIDHKNKEQNHRLDEIDHKDEEQDCRLDKIVLRDEEQDQRLAEIDRKIEEQDHSLEIRGSAWDSLIEQHSDLLQDHSKKFESTDLQLRQHRDTIELLQQENLALQERVHVLEDNLVKLEDRSKTLTTKVFTYCTLAVSAVSLIIGILHFFL